MRIEHLALWTNDLETLKQFYSTYFGASAGALYHNPKKNFTSYFLSFENGPRLEIMHRPEVENAPPASFRRGLIHFAISTGSEARVNELTEQLRKDGYTIAGEPRRTGDGYYESVVMDPDGNLIELTV